MHEKLKETVENIRMPMDMKKRLVRNCTVKRRQNPIPARKKLSAAVSLLALCLAIPTGAFAAGKLGIMRDVKNWQGAITGQVYENATDSISVSVGVEDATLLVTTALVYPDERPFRYIEQLSILEYRIENQSGKKVLKGKETACYPLIDHEAHIPLPISDLPAGSYTLKITSFSGNAKAEQPLPILGHWEHSFQIPEG